MKVAFLGACFLALVAATGCGSASPRSAAADDSAPTTTTKSPQTPLLHLERDDSSSMVLLAEQGTKSAPPRDVYAVFARKQTDEEAKLAPRLLADYPCAAGSENIADQARILLRGVDDAQDTLVAVPTTEGSISVAVFPRGGATCALPTENGLILAADVEGGSATVYGMVEDGVRSVDVVVNGRAHRAKLGENGFTVALRSADEMDVDKLVFQKADGSKTEFPAT